MFSPSPAPAPELQRLLHFLKALATEQDLAAGEVSPEHYQQAVREALRRSLVRQRALEEALLTLPELAHSRLLAALGLG